MSEWDDFYTAVQDSLKDQIEGRAEPYKALWSQADDVMILGADGGCDRGWETVGEGIDLAAAVIHADDRRFENLLTVVGDEVALTVDFEHITKQIPDGPKVTKTLRCTHAYRREGGEWRMFLRHADEYTPGARRGEGGPGGGPPGGGPPGGGPPGGGPPGGGPPGGGPPGGGPPGGGPPGGGPPG